MNQTGYRLLYRMGLIPWDGVPLPAALLRMTASERPGRALDLGCGTGRHSVHLAQHGWKVTGVDVVPRAVAAARRRAASAGVHVEFVEGSITRLPSTVRPGPYDLVLDIGCLHGLDETRRLAAASEITRFTGPNSMLLIVAVAPRRGGGPSGLDAAALATYLPHWRITATEEAPRPVGMNPLGATPIRCYLLIR